PFEDIHRVALSLLQDVLVAKFYCWRSNRRRAGSEWRHQALLCTAGAVFFACAAIRTRSDSLLVVSRSPPVPELASLNLPMRCPCVLPTMNAKVLPRRSSASANCHRRSRGRAKSESSCARPVSTLPTGRCVREALVAGWSHRLSCPTVKHHYLAA